MMRFSPLNPIEFFPVASTCRSNLPHLFCTSDHISFQCFHHPSEPPGALSLVDAQTKQTMAHLTWLCHKINLGLSVSLYTLRGFDAGQYCICIGNEYVSPAIEITDVADRIEGTVLLQYCNHNNYQCMDYYPDVNGRLMFLDLRLDGGFKDSDWEFSVETDFFTTQHADVVVLPSQDVTSKKLTIGKSHGVPTGIGKHLNRIFSCDTVYINGVKYVRESGKELEVSEISKDRFVFRLPVREAAIYNCAIENANQLSLRRTPVTLRRASNYLRQL